MDGQYNGHADGHRFPQKGKNPANSEQDSSSSQQEYFCNDCGIVVHDWFPCLEADHILPQLIEETRAELYYPNLHLDVQPALGEPGSSSWRTDSSGLPSAASNSFSHVDSILTQDTSASTPLFYGHSIRESCEHDNHQDVSDHDVGIWNGAIDGDVVMSDSTNANSHQHLTPDNLTEIQHWLSRWEVRSHQPSHEEICALATLLSVNPHLLVSLIDSAIRLWDPTSQTLANAEISLDFYLSAQERATPEQIQVAEYAQGRNNSSCSNHKSVKVASERKYKCPTHGCHYSADNAKELVKHLLTKWPQEFWHCIRCRENDGKPFICHRRSKLLDHLRSGIHNYPKGPKYDDICDASKVEYSAAFPTSCPFFNAYGPCNAIFSSWNAFIEHCLKHLRGHIPDGPWTSRFQSQRRDNDEDDESSTGSSSYDGKSSFDSVMARRRSALSATPSSGRSTTAPSRSRAGETLTQSKQKPKLLDCIDVRFVEHPERAQYLAMDYSVLYKEEAFIQHHAPDGATGQFGVLQAILPTTIALTRRLGYRYLWLDTACKESSNKAEINAAFDGANLLIVYYSGHGSTEQICHLVCHRSRLTDILSLAQDNAGHLDFTFVRKLGHGVFGVVDEVKHISSSRTFARKTLIAKDGQGDLKHAFREIEMLQNLRHPNISSFVAAYLQHGRVNILTQPVAQCDLRMLLNDPQSWRDKLPYMAEWYRSLASALEHIHFQGYRHTDIKPANILVHGTDVLMSDFSFSRHGHSGSTGAGVFTPKYCAPEVACGRPSGCQADVFSLGCVFLEMMTVQHNHSLRDLTAHLNCSPLQNFNTSITYHAVMDSLQSWIDILQPSASSQYASTILDICRKSLCSNSDKRPSAAMICHLLSPTIANSIPQQLSLEYDVKAATLQQRSEIDPKGGIPHARQAVEILMPCPESMTLSSQRRLAQATSAVPTFSILGNVDGRLFIDGRLSSHSRPFHVSVDELPQEKYADANRSPSSATTTGSSTRPRSHRKSRQTQSTGSDFICGNCNASFPTPSSLHHHLRSHAPYSFDELSHEKHADRMSVVTSIGTASKGARTATSRRAAVEHASVLPDDWTYTNFPRPPYEMQDLSSHKVDFDTMSSTSWTTALEQLLFERTSIPAGSDASIPETTHGAESYLKSKACPTFIYGSRSSRSNGVRHIAHLGKAKDEGRTPRETAGTDIDVKVNRDSTTPAATSSMASRDLPAIVGALDPTELASSIDQFWDLLMQRSGTDTYRGSSSLHNDVSRRVNTTCTIPMVFGAQKDRELFLDTPSDFDDIHRDNASVDPINRILLMATREALEQAGIDPISLYPVPETGGESLALYHERSKARQARQSHGFGVILREDFCLLDANSGVGSHWNESIWVFDIEKLTEKLIKAKMTLQKELLLISLLRENLNSLESKKANYTFDVGDQDGTKQA